MTFVSLGSSCSIAYNLKEHNLRQEAYPFDWTRTLNLNNVSKAIDTKFEEFLNLKKFKLKCYDEKFEVDGGKGSYIYSNGYCSFYHDFNKLLDEFDTTGFVAKYERRINRFLELLSSNKEIIFIREEYGNLNRNKIKKLIESLQSFNSKMNFKIIIITNDLSYKDIIYENLYFYFSDIKIEDWRRPEINWINIFNYK
tara:strand:- start:8629 stop:9219 length:591 start_codon:yes stop_codon:yes gene_type:complete